MGNYCCGEDKPSILSEKDINQTSIINSQSQKVYQNLKVQTNGKQNGERQNGSNESNGKNGQNNNNNNNNNNDKSPLVQFNMYKGQSQLSINDFQKLRKLGQGAFGQVFLVQKKDTREQLAMKYIPKVELLKSNMVERSLIEKKVLQDNHCPFLVDLKYCFQSQNKIYYLMEYIPGGQLFEILQGVGRFTEEVARFIIAEIILGIELMHNILHVIYRDLKPENILLTADGHIKIADFGLSKIFKDKSEKTYTFAGTPEYLAPEIILNKGHNKDVDLWCIGILLYELMLGSPPFTTNPRNLDKIQAAIIRNRPVFPNFFSVQAIDLIKKLLQTEPEKRLGAQDFKDLKEHQFFESINWKDLMEKKVKSPLQKYVKNSDKQGQYCKPRPIYETPVNPGLNLPYIKGLSYNPDMMQSQQ